MIISWRLSEEKSDGIHSVANRGEEVSYTLHVYGRNLEATGRRQYDPEAKSVQSVAYDLE